jgi:hypothetical protein
MASLSIIWGSPSPYLLFGLQMPYNFQKWSWRLVTHDRDCARAGGSESEDASERRLQKTSWTKSRCQWGGVPGALCFSPFSGSQGYSVDVAEHSLVQSSRSGLCCSIVTQCLSVGLVLKTERSGNSNSNNHHILISQGTSPILRAS